MTDPSVAHGDEPKEQKGVVDFVLSLFADVKANEGVTALILMVDVFLLLVAYYLLKTVREPLILASGGVQAKNYATGIQAVVLMGLVPAYAALTQRLKRMTLITVTLLFFASNLLLFWVLARLQVPGLGGAFFVWLGCFSLVVLAQFWSFANDLYTPEQGKRLFAIVGIGGSVGAWVGSKLAEYLTSPASPDSKDPRMSEFAIMLVSAALLLLCLGLGWMATLREGGLKKGGAAAEDKPIGGKNGLALIRSDRYLLLIAAVIMILNLVNTTGESILDLSILEKVKAATPGWDSLPEEAQEKAIKAFVGPFRGNFFSWVNLIGAATQMFLVSRIFKYLGIRAALFSLPLIGVLVYGGIVAIPLLAFVRIGKIAENSVDYSLYNTTKQALWLPTSREEKYNAKMTIDSFLVRIGDLVASGLSLGLLALGFGIRTYAAVNLALIAGWLLLAWLIGRENQARMEEKDAPTSSEAIKKQLKNTVTGDSSAIREAIEKAKREKQKR
ncbi:MAG TPA: Npt1/Npt2 family nucleotide transporter [Polyangiaceae bacterium]|nr:Npt1/Npt2 family nucleotide transporter [Polyangiaceae bacterium]